jgi:uncharacterized membrane protein
VPRPFVIIIAIYSVAGAFVAVAAMDVRLPLLLPFHWHKALHVLGAVMMLGNALVTGVWTAAAMRAESREVLRFALRFLSWADVFFTAPGFLLLTFNGAVLASAWGGVYAWSWLVTALLLLGVAGAVGTVVIPLQIKLYKLADRVDDPPAMDEIRRTLRRWSVVGSVATLPLVAILFVMALKPRLW